MPNYINKLIYKKLSFTKAVSKFNVDSRLKASLTKYQGTIFLSLLGYRTVTVDLRFTSLVEADYLTVHVQSFEPIHLTAESNCFSTSSTVEARENQFSS